MGRKRRAGPQLLPPPSRPDGSRSKSPTPKADRRIKSPLESPTRPGEASTSTDVKSPSPGTAETPSTTPSSPVKKDAVQFEGFRTTTEEPTDAYLTRYLKRTDRARESPRPPAARDVAATSASPQLLFPRKITPGLRDDPGNISRSGANGKARAAVGSSPSIAVRLGASEEVGGRHVSGKALDLVPGERRKSSVRFGQTTYKEIEEQSDSANMNPVPKRFATALTLFMIVCTFVILVLLYALTPPIKARAIQHCATRACNEAMTFIDNLTDRTANPCIDFYSYVCGSWSAAPDAGFVHDVTVSLWTRANRTLIESTDVGPDLQGTHVLHSFYEACYDFIEGRSQQAKSAFDVFFGYFGRLADMIQGPYPSLLTALINISISHGLDSVFSVRLVAWKPYASLLVQRTASIRRKLGGDSTRRTVDGYVLEFLQRASNASFVRDYHLKLLSLDDEVDAVVRSDAEVEIIPFQHIQNLTRHLTPENWLLTVNAVLPTYRWVSPEDLVKVGNVASITRVFDVLDLRNDATLRAAYLYVQLAAEVLRFDYRGRYKTVGTVYFCLGESQKVLSHTWPYLFTSVVQIPDRKGTITELFKGIRDELLKHLDWMDVDARYEAALLLGNVTLTYFSASSNVPSIPAINYANVTASRTEFLSSYLFLKRHEQKVHEALPPTTSLGRVNRMLLDGSLTYVRELHSLLIPPGYALSPMFYSSGVPEYFDFATLGALIAKELSKAIGPLAGSTWWSTPMKATFNDTLRCLLDEYKEMSFSSNTRQLAESIFAWTRSARLTYDLTQKLLAASPEGHVAVAQRVFFRRFCLTSCASQEGPGPLTPRQRCMLPLLSMKEFAAVYRCPRRLGTAVRWCKIL